MLPQVLIMACCIRGRAINRAYEYLSVGFSVTNFRDLSQHMKTFLQELAHDIVIGSTTAF